MKSDNTSIAFVTICSPYGCRVVTHTGWEYEKSIINNIKAFTIYLFFRTFPLHSHKKRQRTTLLSCTLSQSYLCYWSFACFFHYSIRNGAGNVVSFFAPYGMVQETLFLSLLHTEWCRKRCFFHCSIWNGAGNGVSFIAPYGMVQ